MVDDGEESQSSAMLKGALAGLTGYGVVALIVGVVASKSTGLPRDILFVVASLVAVYACGFFLFALVLHVIAGEISISSDESVERGLDELRVPENDGSLQPDTRSLVGSVGITAGWALASAALLGFFSKNASDEMWGWEAMLLLGSIFAAAMFLVNVWGAARLYRLSCQARVLGRENS